MSSFGRSRVMTGSSRPISGTRGNSRLFGSDSFLLGGYGELENGSARRICADPQSTAVRLDDRAADGQADAQTVWLGGEESFEQKFHLVGRQANPAIRYSARRGPRRFRARAKPEKPRPVIDGRHRLYAIRHQVHDDLL